MSNLNRNHDSGGEELISTIGPGRRGYLSVRQAVHFGLQVVHYAPESPGQHEASDEEDGQNDVG